MANKQGLDPKTYVALEKGESYVPYISTTQTLPEFTIKSVIFGILFGIIFGAANAYLGLVAQPCNGVDHATKVSGAIINNCYH